MEPVTVVVPDRGRAWWMRWCRVGTRFPGTRWVVPRDGWWVALECGNFTTPRADWCRARWVADPIRVVALLLLGTESVVKPPERGRILARFANHRGGGGVIPPRGGTH